MTSPHCDRLHLADLQAEVGAWADHNFKGPYTGSVGLVEEVGELSEAYAQILICQLASKMGKLARAYVKRTQGIRGTREEWDEEFRKEAADIVIKLSQICHDEHFSLEAAVVARWMVVQQRDWVANRQGHGIPADD